MFIFLMFGTPWVSVIELHFGWRNWFGKYSLVLWNLAPLCLLWTLWKKKNHCTFEGVEASVTQLNRLS
jgi:hypothetical protein